MNTLSLETNFIQSDHVKIRQEHFGAMVFDKRTWTIKEVNSSGFHLLNLFDGKHTLKENINSFAKEYEDCDDKHEKNILSYCEELYNSELIEPAPEYEAKSNPSGRGVEKQKTLKNLLEEGHQDKRLENDYLRSPLFVWWDVTYTCNLKCKQCYSNSGQTQNSDLSTAEAKDLIDQLAEAGVFYIYFLGGEPFMRKDFLELVEYTVSRDMGVMINTNGWFVDADIASRLKKAGVFHVRVSVDGATANTHDSIRGGKGSFDRAIQAVECLKKADIPFVSIAPTVMRENVSEISSLIDLAATLEVSEIQLVQMTDTGRGQKENIITHDDVLMLKTIVDEKKQRYPQMRISASEGIATDKPFKKEVQEGDMSPRIMGCAGGRSSCSISAEGNVLPCLLYRKEVGSIRETSFKDIWFNAPLFKQARTVKEVCQKCQFGNVCSGLCPIEPMSSSDRENSAQQFVENNFTDREATVSTFLAPEIRPYLQIDAPGCMDSPSADNNSSGQTYYAYSCPCVSPCYCVRP